MNLFSIQRTCLLIILLFAFYACGKKSNPVVPMAITPKPPENLQAFPRAGEILLVWRTPNKNTDESPLIDLGGFKIFREEVPFEKRCQKCPKNFLLLYDYDYRGPRGKKPEKKYFYYRDRNLTYKNVYIYKIHAYNEKSITSDSSKWVTVYWDVPPAPPADIKVIKRGRIITLEWQTQHSLVNGTLTSDIEGYNVYRSTEKGIYDIIPINNELITGFSYEDIPPVYDKTYFYIVRSVRNVIHSHIESEPSEEIAVVYMDTTPPSTPRGLTAIPSDEGVLLKWLPKTEKGFAGFHIYRKRLGDQDFIRINDKLVRQNSWVDKTAKIRKTYVYGITAVDSSINQNESPLSETVTIRYIVQ